MIRTERPANYSGCPATILAAEQSDVTLVSPRWGVADAVIAGVVTFILAISAALVLQSVGLIGTGLGLILASTVPWLAMAGWPLWVTRRYGNGPALDLGLRLTWFDVGFGVAGGVVALILGSLAAVLTTFVVGDFESAAGEAVTAVAENSAQWQLITFAVLVVIGAPFAEEILFRGLLWAGLRRRGWSAWATALTTTAAFALFHFELTRIVVLLVIGAVLAFVRYRTEALGASMVTHAINNLPGAIAILTLA